MGQGVYIDLFDDGIPTRNPIVTTEGFEGDLVDVARFQVLLALLLGKTVVVPEMWAVSSPLFLKISNEVLGAWTRQNWTQSGRRSDKRPEVPPFALGFIGDRLSESPVRSWLLSLHWRLQTGRRLMFAPGLGDAKSAERRGLADAVARTLGEPDIGDHEIDRLDPSIRRILRGIDERWAADGASDAIGQLLKYLNHRLSEDVAAPYDEAVYRSVAEQQVAHVRAAVGVHASGLATEFGAPATGFVRFFHKVRESGLSLGNVMALEKLLDDEPDDVAEPVRAFGRYVISRAHAQAVGAENQAFSMAYHCRRKAEDFATALLDGVIAQERRPDRLAAAGPDFDEFLQLAPVRSYDLADTLPWDQVWSQIARLVGHADWTKTVAALKSEVYTRSEAELRDRGVWVGFFDTVNASVQDVLFKLDGGDKPALRLVKAMPTIGRAAGHIDKFGPALGPAAKLAAKGTYELCSVTVETLAKLVGTTPTKAVLKAERLRRKAATLLR